MSLLITGLGIHLSKDDHVLFITRLGIHLSKDDNVLFITRLLVPIIIVKTLGSARDLLDRLERELGVKSE